MVKHLKFAYMTLSSSLQIVGEGREKSHIHIFILAVSMCSNMWHPTHLVMQ